MHNVWASFWAQNGSHSFPLQFCAKIAIWVETYAPKCCRAGLQNLHFGPPMAHSRASAGHPCGSFTPSKYYNIRAPQGGDRSLIDPWSILDRSLIDPWSVQDSGSPPDKFRLIPWLPYQKEKERFLPWGEHKRLLWPFRGPKGSFKGPRGLPWAPGGSPKSFPWGVKMLQNHYKTCVILRIVRCFL